MPPGPPAVPPDGGTPEAQGGTPAARGGIPATPRTTLAEIAAGAGISLSTVSKVLNGRPGIADDTRARIEQLLRDCGYERQNVERPQQLIEIVLSEVDAWTMELIRGVERVSREAGLATMLTQSDDKHSPDRGWLERTLARKPAGVILVFADLTDDEKAALRQERIPFAVIDPLTGPVDDVPAVGASNWFGALQATEHLLRLGHRRIATITGPMDMISSRARLAGYRTALEEAGVPQRPEYVANGSYYQPEGTSLARQLLSLSEPPTAIFAMNDVQALGVYAAAQDLGVRIPDQLSVIGFDDLDVAGWADPPLTTVRQPLIEMGSAAAHLVLQRHESAADRPSRMDLATTLIERHSTAVRPG